MNRVITVGHSAGGHLAFWLAARHRRIYPLLIMLLFMALVHIVNAADDSITRREQHLFTIIEDKQDLKEISKSIWENLLGAGFVNAIQKFKTQNPIPFQQIKAGATWASLKKELDINMVQKIPGASYSWEEYRDIDKAFKENLVNRALHSFSLEPVKWGVTGTIGYNSDIDNVAQGTSPFQEIIAKILMDTLHVYMYETTSDLTFDEEVYTQHPGATLQTLRHLENNEAKEKYHKIAFSLEQLQIYRHTRDSKVLPWSTYKSEFIKAFPDVKSVLESTERFEDELAKADSEDQKMIQSHSHVSKGDIMALIDMKSIAALSKQILQHDQRVEELESSLKNQRKKLLGSKTDKDLNTIILAASKEKDDLLIQSALLFALRGTYFPESYFTQEAFQIIVMGDQPISQVLTNMIDEYMRKGNPQSFDTIDQLRAFMVEKNPQLFIKSTLFTHLISMGEQLGYFIHKIETPDVLSPDQFMKGAKYLGRFSFSFDQAVKQLGVSHIPEIDQKFVNRLNQVAAVLSVFQRGKIYISVQRITQDMTDFIKKTDPSLTDEQVKSMATAGAEYIVDKTSKSVLRPQQRLQACADLFKDNKKLSSALDATIVGGGVVTRDEKITLLLNAALGKARHENDLIKRAFDSELKKAYADLNLVQEKDLKEFLEQIVKGYIAAVKAFYQLPENKFDPYSLNYNEVELSHTFNPAYLIQEKKADLSER